MDINELRSQAIAEHAETVDQWVAEKKANIKQSLADKLAQNQRDHEDIVAQLEAFDDQPEEVHTDSEVTETQG